ncbi:flagellar protein FliS [Nocardioides sp. W3-2-3]|uniref:flagellar export chaperone FliS n=1 Tax=Nocardioides convexus TaxID=2712224 RepID=UPI0024188D6F|nr:flagellar protein FliS [Nocardioides convexus]NHA00567.1 flagellar protein FliS [Nocardioides convexus]
MYATRTVHNAQSAYRENAVATASPARLLVMLVERLVLDGERALAAQEAGAWTEAHRHLLHAQDIVIESGVEPRRREDARGQADSPRSTSTSAAATSTPTSSATRRPPARPSTCRASLCDTWREAAMAAAVTG